MSSGYLSIIKRFSNHRNSPVINSSQRLRRAVRSQKTVGTIAKTYFEKKKKKNHHFARPRLRYAFGGNIISRHRRWTGISVGRYGLPRCVKSSETPVCQPPGTREGGEQAGRQAGRYCSTIHGSQQNRSLTSGADRVGKRQDAVGYSGNDLPRPNKRRSRSSSSCSARATQ